MCETKWRGKEVFENFRFAVQTNKDGLLLAVQGCAREVKVNILDV
jgi:hypothetical protein